MSSTEAVAPAALVAFLQGDEARGALARLAALDTGDAASLRLLQELRRSFAPWQAAALLSQARLRKRAAAKWPFAPALLLVEEALEQATAWPLALHRARRLHALAPPGPLLDLGCGIGGDTLALATLRPVIAWERDPLRAELARANVAALGRPRGALHPLQPVTVLSGDWREDVGSAQAGAMQAGAMQAGGAFADPARRVTAPGAGESRRVFSLQSMEPPLHALLPLLDQLAVLAVKVAPGVQEAELPAGAALEFVSHAGSAKEGVLWLGEAASVLPARWAAVYDGAAWHEISGGAPAPALAAHELPQPGQLIWEPDPAVLRAGALDTLCAQLGARLFAPDIAYLVADPVANAPAGDAHPAPAVGPFATPFRLIEAAPFSLKRLNQRLAALGAGAVELKKRGFPLEPEALRPRLKVQRGGRPLTVLLTRRGDAHWMLLCERLAPSPAA